jgi:rhodanese-related sulfurtransferase
MASHQAARRAAALGYTKVFVMPDGIDGWIAAGKPVEKG